MNTTSKSPVEIRSGLLLERLALAQHRPKVATYYMVVLVVNGQAKRQVKFGLN